MTMQKISEWKGEPSVVKSMFEMESGEVCKTITEGIGDNSGDKYILCIKHCGQETVYLILNDKYANSYGHSCGIKVRELNNNENIVVKFS